MEALPVAALWALTITAQKYSLGSLKPATAFIIVTLLHTCFLLTYLATHWGAFRDDLSNVSNRLSIILVFGVMASFIGNLMYYRTLQGNAAPVVSSVISSVPLFVALFSFMFFGTKITARQYGGMILVLFGVHLLN
jgi:uncharacterized membrane protein